MDYPKIKNEKLKMKNHNPKLKILNFALSFCILFFALFILASQASAATLFLAPSMGSYSAGDTFSVSVKVNTEGKAINTAEATLTFDPSRLKVKSISKTGSIFTLWVEEPVFSNSDGMISFAGGKPSPGYTGSSGKLLSITFKGLTSGEADVNFSSASVLADDGRGTNILSSLISGSYTITTKEIKTIPSQEKYVPPATPGETPAAPVISSATHPNPDKWYSNNNPEFSWDLPSGVTAVRLLMGHNPTAIPTITYIPPISEKKLEDLSDGTWYFHARFKNNYGWGEITHRKVLIDTEPPESFKVIFDNEDDSTNPTPIFNFITTDALSGIEYYEVLIKQEDRTITTTTQQNIKDNPYQSLPLPPGKHEVVVKAFDKAENFSSASTEFEILPIEGPEITEIPISIRMGDPLVIEGKAPSGLQVAVYIQKEDGEPVVEKIKSDKEGRFKLTYDKTLAKGDYLVWARTEDERGALSLPTEKYAVEVGLPPFLKIGKMAIDYLTIMITFIILIVGVGVIIFYSWYRISVWRKRVRGETKEVSESVATAFKALREEVEEQIEFLDGKPGLNKDERKVRDKLKEALDISEKFIGKEIKDVEKELE